MSNQVYSSGQSLGYFPNVRAKDLLRSGSVINYDSYAAITAAVPPVIADWPGLSSLRMDTLNGFPIANVGGVYDPMALQSSLTIDSYELSQNTTLADGLRGIRLVAKKDCVLEIGMTIPYHPLTNTVDAAFQIVKTGTSGNAEPLAIKVEHDTQLVKNHFEHIETMARMRAGEILDFYIRFGSSVAPGAGLGATVGQVYTQKPEISITKLN